MSELTVEEVQKLKVADLKTELAARDLPTKGLKKDLVERLTEALQGGGSQADPAGQTSGEAPQLADEAQANTESLPSELPAVPPANEDSVQDLEGAEPKLSEEKASNGVETAPGESEVVRPDVNSLDQTPGVVSSTAATETDTNGTADVGEKRKRDEEQAVLPLNSAPESVAAQAETAQPGNDSVPAPPADVEEPDTKRLKTDGDDAGVAAGSADIPVPSATSDIPVPEQSSDASASLLAPQADPILPLNEAIVPDTSSSGAAAAPGSEDPKSVQASYSTLNGTASSSSSTTLSHPPTADPNNLQSRKSFSIRGKGADRKSGNSDEDRSSARMTKIGNITPDTSVDSDRRGSSNSVAKMSHTIATQNEKMQLDDQAPALATDADLTEMDIDASHQSSSMPSQSIPAAPNDALSSSADARLSTDGYAKTTDSEKPPPSTSICVSNLVRPFTLPSLKEKLEEFGSYSYFWINAVKSHCFVSYDKIETAEEVSAALDGIVWPDRTGKQLSVIYVPDSEISRLVAAEEEAGRARLELVVKKNADTSEWEYDVEAPSAVSSAGNGKAAASVRGLASAVPSAARRNTSNPFPLGTPASAPPTSLASRGGAGPPGNRLFQQANSSRTSVVTASGASIQIPRSSAFSQSTIPAGPASASIAEPARRLDEDRIWQPARGAESTYKQTQSTPKIWFRPVDAVTAGRKLRDLAREQQKAAPRRQSGIRDSYRP